MERLATTILGLVPRLKTPIQLTGFAIATVSVFILYFVKPGNIAAQSSGGAIGILITIFPLLFHNIEKFRPQDRARAVATIFIFFCVVITVLSLITTLLLFFTGNQRREAAMFERSVATLNQRLETEAKEMQARVNTLHEEADSTADFGVRQLLLAEISGLEKRLQSIDNTLSNIELAPETLTAIDFSEPSRQNSRLQPIRVSQDFLDSVYDSVSAGKIGEAERLVTSAVAESTAVLGNFLARRAWVRELNGDTSGAIADLQKSIEVSGPSARAYLAIARLAHNEGDIDLALKSAKKAVSQYRAEGNFGVEGMVAAMHLAMLQRLVGDPDSAIKTDEDALSGPQNASFESRVVRANLLGDLSVILTTSGHLHKSESITSEAITLISTLEGEAAQHQPMDGSGISPTNAAQRPGPAAVFGASSIWAAAGHFNAYKGDFQMALRYHHEAALRPPLSASGVAVDLGALLINEGVALTRTGNIQEGYKKVEKGWSIVDRSTGKNSYHRLRSLLWLAEASLAINKDKEAESALERAAVISDEIASTQPSETALAKILIAEMGIVLRAPQVSEWIDGARAALVPDSTEMRVRYYARLFRVIDLSESAADFAEVNAAGEAALQFIQDVGMTGGYYEAEVRSWILRAARSQGVQGQQIKIIEKRLSAIISTGACPRVGLIARTLNG